MPTTFDMIYIIGSSFRLVGRIKPCGLFILQSINCFIIIFTDTDENSRSI